MAQPVRYSLKKQEDPMIARSGATGPDAHREVRVPEDAVKSEQTPDQEHNLQIFENIGETTMTDVANEIMKPLVEAMKKYEQELVQHREFLDKNQGTEEYYTVVKAAKFVEPLPSQMASRLESHVKPYIETFELAREHLYLARLVLQGQLTAEKRVGQLLIDEMNLEMEERGLELEKKRVQEREKTISAKRKRVDKELAQEKKLCRSGSIDTLV